MRPGVEALARRRVPQGVSVAVHYLVIVGLIALFIWLVVPRALGQVEEALGVSSLPTSAGDLDQAADNSTVSVVAGRRKKRELADAREDALRWYERLGGQVMNLHRRRAGGPAGARRRRGAVQRPPVPSWSARRR